MKQVKILYEKCKKKMPHRPPDEIDFGLGFRAALGWQKQTMIDNADQETLTFSDIEKELE